MKTFVDFIYTVLIGVAVALFVGLGIWTFYTGPKMPEYPNYSSSSLNPTEAENKAFQQRQDAFDKKMKQYDKDNKSYSKKVGVIALGSAVVFYAVGLALLYKRWVVGEGIALGGVFSAVYAAIRGTMADFKQLVFSSVTVILAMLILLTIYRLRIHTPVKAKKS